MTKPVFLSILLLVALLIITFFVVRMNSTAAEHPNIIFINLDDADIDLLDEWAINKFFPNIKKYIQDQGVRFSNFHSVAPLCGPSRGALFRGQYLHNTGIEKNALGWQIFYERGYTDSEIGMWMRDAGYETGLVGKYCHEKYPHASRDGTYHPPGWDTFHASMGANYFNLTRIMDGERIKTGATEYRTDLESISTKDILLNRDPKKPLFLYLAPFAPHKQSAKDKLGMVAARHKDSFPDVRFPITPDFDEEDVSDKTPQYAALPRANDKAIERAFISYERRVRSMLAVDEMVGELFETLRTEDILDNTYVFLSSDNGFQLFHHRVFAKKDPFDRTTRVQLLVRGPGVPENKTFRHLLGHIDLAPTFLELAGAKVPHFVDGKSFVALLHNASDYDEPDWREALLIENVEGKKYRKFMMDLEYTALRRFSDIYVEWANGDREYYDLAEDPWQLENSWKTLDDSVRDEITSSLAKLANCTGAACNGGAAADEIDTQLDLQNETIFDQSEIRITGTANDDSAVARVEIVVRADNRDYLGKDKLMPGYRSFDAVLADKKQPKTAWHIDRTLPPGDYWISARAIDNDGNEDPISPTAFFSVKPRQ